jgi:hypothetical protein
MVAIQTKFIGPTNTRGSRVKAWIPNDRAWASEPVRALTIDWNHALDSEDNHKAAAVALIARLGWGEENGYHEQWYLGAVDGGCVAVYAADYAKIDTAEKSEKE